MGQHAASDRSTTAGEGDVNEEPHHGNAADHPPEVPRNRRWVRTTGDAMLWALAGALGAWWGSTIVLSILRQELDLDVPRGLRSWLPLVMAVVVLVGIALLLVRRLQRSAVAAPPAPGGVPVPPWSGSPGPGPVPSYGSTVGQVGSSLAVGLVGALIGAVVVGGASILLVLLLMAVTVPEAGWLFLLVPVAAIIGGVVGAAIAMGRRR